MNEIRSGRGRSGHPASLLPSPLVSVLAATLAMALPNSGFADNDPPCSAFLIPPSVPLLKEAKANSKVLRVSEKWLVALPNPGHVFGVVDKIRIESSDNPEKSAGCYEKDFTVRNGFIRLWIEPQHLRQERAWVKFGALKVFNYPYPGNWMVQDLAKNLMTVQELADAARNGAPSRGGEAQPPQQGSQRELRLQANVSTVWPAALEAVIGAGWKIDSADRGSGLISSKPRRLHAASAVNCLSHEDDEGEFSLALIVLSQAESTVVRAVLSLDHPAFGTDVCRSRGLIEDQVLRRLESIAGR